MQSAFGSYDGYDLLEVTGLADALKHVSDQPMAGPRHCAAA